MPLPSSILDSIYHINRKEEAVNVISIMAVAVFGTAPACMLEAYACHACELMNAS
jgi:hypothetical protein